MRRMCLTRVGHCSTFPTAGSGSPRRAGSKAPRPPADAPPPVLEMQSSGTRERRRALKDALALPSLASLDPGASVSAQGLSNPKRQLLVAQAHAHLSHRRDAHRAPRPRPPPDSRVDRPQRAAVRDARFERVLPPSPRPFARNGRGAVGADGLAHHLHRPPGPRAAVRARAPSAPGDRLAFELVSGGRAPLFLLLGPRGRASELMRVDPVPRTEAVESCTTEFLRYREDLTYVPDPEPGSID